MGAFMVFINQVFPCSHCFNKTTPSHIHKIFHIFHFRGKGNWNVTKLSHLQVVASGKFVIKKHPNLKKRVFNYQKLVCEEFLMHIIY